MVAVPSAKEKARRGPGQVRQDVTFRPAHHCRSSTSTPPSPSGSCFGTAWLYSKPNKERGPAASAANRASEVMIGKTKDCHL